MTKSLLERRHATERRFRRLGVIAVALAMGFLAVLLVSILVRGLPAFVQSQIHLDITFTPAEVDEGDYQALARNGLKALFPDISGRTATRALNGLLSASAGDVLRDMITQDPALRGQTVKVWVPAADTVDTTRKGTTPDDPNASGARISAEQKQWILTLEKQDRLAMRLNTTFFTSGDSRDPTQAGILGAVMGSVFTIIITLVLSFPLGVATAVYLEEYAKKNRLADLIEVNINNLAAVPSIVFGLLGLAIFLNLFGLGRSTPLVGGLVLTLMTLPTIIIAARAALKAVPPSIREAALGLGASRLQTITHHILPLALPGILTGTILGMARALGETAPLLMIGMVAFIVDVPTSPTDSATALPVQIYLWAASPERAFVEKTSAAIIVLLLFLAVMNITAIVLRKKFERRW